MSVLFPRLPRGHRRRGPGGILTYSADRLWEEVVYVAYYLHWSADSVLDLEHPARQRVIEEIGRINQKISGPQGPEL
ncbi:DUF6760 family protein [Streptomyces sp. NPDC051014]|uniref:DUF6760 family protein n=1 Tax=Streptomyces sp. NPDC051014 TaxID=3155751 RepID=UPI0034070B2F